MTGSSVKHSVCMFIIAINLKQKICLYVVFTLLNEIAAS